MQFLNRMVTDWDTFEKCYSGDLFICWNYGQRTVILFLSWIWSIGTLIFRLHENSWDLLGQTACALYISIDFHGGLPIYSPTTNE